MNKFLVERLDRADGLYRFEAFPADGKARGVVVSEELEAIPAMGLAAKLNETAKYHGRLLPGK